MPFASDKQRRYLWSQKPEVAKKFAEHHADGGMAGGMQVKKVTEKDRYGNQISYEFEVPEKGIDQTALMKHQMDMAKDMMPEPEMMVPMMDEGHPGEPRGSDTVPAWLTPGEFVVNAEAMRIPGAAEQVEQINDMGREIQAQQGGSIPEMMAGGGFVKEKAHSLIEKMDPAAIARLMGQASDYFQAVQPVLGFEEGGFLGYPSQKAYVEAAAKRRRENPPDFADTPEQRKSDAFLSDPYTGIIREAWRSIWGENNYKPYNERYKADGGMATPVPPPWTQRPEGTEELLHEREGYVPEIYLDSLGKPTVGYGHLIEDKVWDKNDPRVGTQPYSEAELKAFFDQDVQAAQSGAVENIGRETWVNLNPAQQRALTSMAFQLGEAGQRKFGNMISAIQAGDYDAAAREALTGSKPGTKSKWLKQTPKRAFDLAEAFSPGISAQYKQAGGVVYADDGGWGNWLKNAANKYVLGPKGREALGTQTIDDLAIADAGMTDIDQGPPLEVPPEEDFAVPSVEADFDEESISPEAPAVPPRPFHGAAQDINPNTLANVELKNEANLEDAREASGQSKYHFDQYGPSDATMAQLGQNLGVDEAPPPVEDEATQAALAESGQSSSHYEVYGPSDETKKAMEEQENTTAVTKPPFAQPDIDPASPEGEKEMDDIVAAADTEQRKQAQNEAQSVFQELGLDSLFDKKELARMAVMYAGSRLLGYDHGGSLGWAAKNYINRVDAKEQGYAQLALSGKYKPASLKAFKQSGNYEDLEPIGASVNRTGEFKTFYGPNGKQQRAEKVKVGDQTVWKTGDGRVVDSSWSDDASAVAGTPEYGKRIKEDTNLYSGMITDLRKTFGTTPGGRDQPDTYATELAPNVAGGKIAKWAADNNVPAEYMGTIVENAYHSAIEHGKQTGEKVRDLTPFLEEQYVVSQVGDSSLFQGISGTNVSKLFSAVDNAYGGKYSTAQAMQVYRDAWNNLPPEQQEWYNNNAGKEQNGFMLFVQNDVNTKYSGG